MKTFKIALIPGDGIGPEVVAEGVKVLKTIERLDKELEFSYTEFPWGCEYNLTNGKMMAADGIDKLTDFDAIYLGAVGDLGGPEHMTFWDVLLIIRIEFDK